VIQNERGKIIVICNEEVSPFTLVLHFLFPNSHTFCLSFQVAAKKDKLKLDWAAEIITFPDNGPVWWEKHREEGLARVESAARKYEGRLFMVSVGPLAKVLVSHMWDVNPRNRYVDFGSAIDELLKGRPTRGYTDPNSYYGKWVDASWQLDPNGVPVIVSDSSSTSNPFLIGIILFLALTNMCSLTILIYFRWFRQPYPNHRK